MQGLGLDFEFYKSTFINYGWYGLFIMIYLGGLVYILQQKTGQMKQVFVIPFAFFLVTVFNPFVIDPILEMTDWRDRYSRFFWMLPVEFLSAYILAYCIERQKRVETRVPLIIFVICLIYLCGGSATEMELDDNIYKIDDSVIEVAELIEETSVIEDPIVFWDEDLYYWIRQYDPALIAAVKPEEMDYYRWMKKEEINADEQYGDEARALSMFVRGIEVEPETVNQAIKNRRVDFFVRNKEFYSDEYLGQLDIVYAGEVEGYELYRCVHD